MRHSELQPLEAELDVLFKVISGAVGRDARLGLAAKQFVHRHAKRVTDEIPERQVDAADRVGGDTGAVVIHGRAPEDVPDALDIERIFAEE